MSDLRTLRFLIEAAERERDDTARRAARARIDADAAGNTRRVLHDYRLDLQRRAPATRTESFDPALLAPHVAFTCRLDTAIVEQDRNTARCERIADTVRLDLVERQRRLHSLQALVQRRLAQAAAVEQRAEQKRTDEFAAHAHARARREAAAGGRP